jgi:hypothetical protein
LLIAAEGVLRGITQPADAKGHPCGKRQHHDHRRPGREQRKAEQVREGLGA